MDASAARARSNLLWAGVIALAAALAFWIFFQASKLPMFANANPFADDPVDAIGSIGFEVALVAGLLSLGRALRVYRSRAPDDHRPRLALRGIGMVVLALGAAVVADGVREMQQPGWDVSAWGKLLILGRAGLAALDVLTGVALVRAERSLPALPPERPAGGPGWLGEALEDVFLLGWLPAVWLGARVPLVGRLVWWVEVLWAGTPARRLRRALAWISPWTHPWRFALLAGLAAGIGIAAAHVTEGLPPEPGTFVLVSLVFIAIEFVATVAGFLVIGGYLGLRPPLRR